MFRSYALAVGRGAHRCELEARCASLNLPIRLATKELLLLATPGTACLRGRNAILVGQIFDQSNKRLDELPAQIERAASTADLCDAIRQYWGNFALFYGSENDVAVYREPSGSVAVYRVENPGGTVFVSDADLASKLGLLERLNVDDKFLVHWLQFPFLRTARTGIAHVKEVLPGTFLWRTRSMAWTETPLWRPSTFTGPDRLILDPIEAAERLRETLLSVVAIQANSTPLVLRLSGGLDSSIIAACLSRGERNFSCLNFSTRARDGDERGYARSVAEAFNLKLIGVREAEVVTLERTGQLEFRPTVNPLLAPSERAVGLAAEELGASLLLDGGGGDNLFCSITSATPVLDALRQGGFRAGMRAISDTAVLANCTIWEVVRATARQTFRRRPPWPEDRSLLDPDILLESPEPHPWLEDLPVLPGKREHVEALVHIQHFLDRSSLKTPLLHPLFAQPLLELCLRIPSWLWVKGGRDRAMARNALAGILPTSVLDRRRKGSLQSILYRSFAQLRGEMPDVLVEGELARANILDRTSLHASLTGDAWMSLEIQLRVSELVALELWLQSWRSHSPAVSTSS